MDDLRRTILKDPLVARVFDSGREAFLVGGYVRDFLRGMRARDIDFVVRGEPGSAVADIFPGKEGRVISFRDTLLLRVIVGDTTVDFSELKGGIEDDLATRDFTVDAIAWSPERGLIDPLKGARDIAAGMLRGISEKNFAEDPLRLLRAYRLSAQLGWTIDEPTRGMIRKLKQSIKVSATERITLEFYKLLNADRFHNALKQALEDGLLQYIIALDSLQLRENLKALSSLESFLKKIPEGLRPDLDKEFSQGLSRIGLLRAEQILCGSEMLRNNLRMSRPILKRLVNTTRLLCEYMRIGALNDSDVFDLFTEAGDGALDVALLARKTGMLRKAGRFLQTPSLLAADEVMRVTGLTSGPELGRVLHDMKKQQFLKKIRDERDARNWLSRRSRRISAA
jgi:tRNA nucleotidyltransferase/poly(A) polymerase